MEGLLLVAIFCTFIAFLVYQDKQYKGTAYYQITQNSYASIWSNKGNQGEYLTYQYLQYFEDNGGKFLFNIYLPKINNETAEIDLLLICTKGLFVFESKNYSGWIFGNEAHKTWTQTLPAGRGRSHKERFYNPITQNASHIKHLKRIVGADIPMQSVIVFSDRCTLKDITVRSSNVSVIKRNDAASVIAGICERLQGGDLTQMEMSNIYNKLYPYTQVDYAVKAQHVENVQKYKDLS